MEKFTFRKKLSAAALAAVGAVTLTSCAEPDYVGARDYFEIRGTVHDIDDGVIKINEKQVEVIHASGDAQGWFTEGKGQDWWSEEYNLYASYNRQGDGFWDGCTSDHIVVGKVYDNEGHHIPQSDLDAGDILEIEGRIRDSNKDGKGCPTEERAVYDRVILLEDH